MDRAPDPGPGPGRPAPRGAASFGRTARAVAWSFFGVRRRRDYEHDAASLNPVHVILMGVAAAALFVVVLLVVVNLVV